MRKVFEKLLDDNLKSIKEFILSYIETYQVCINTSNPDFITEILNSDNTIQDEILNAIDITKYEKNYKPELVLNSSKMPVFQLPDRMTEITRLNIIKTQMLNKLLTGLNYNKNEASLELPEQIKLHKHLSKCYFEYIRKMVRDFVPKRINHKMINLFLKNLDKRLNEDIYQTYLKEKKIDEILSENESFEKNRKNVETKLDAVRNALKNMVDIQYL